MAGGEIVHATSAGFDAAVRDGLVLVDFWAAWCGPCRAVAPILDELASELAGRLRIVKVNVDQEGALAGRFGVTSIPTLAVFRDGQPVERVVGLRSKAALLETLSQFLPREGARHASDH